MVLTRKVGNKRDREILIKKVTREDSWYKPYVGYWFTVIEDYDEERYLVTNPYGNKGTNYTVLRQDCITHNTYEEKETSLPSVANKHASRTIQVLVHQCTREDSWYFSYVGHTFDVIDEYDEERYVVKNPYGDPMKKYTIFQQDCRGPAVRASLYKFEMNYPQAQWEERLRLSKELQPKWNAMLSLQNLHHEDLKMMKQLGPNWYRSEYECVQCNKDLFKTVFPIGGEYHIQIVSPFKEIWPIKRAFACSWCQTIYGPKPGYSYTQLHASYQCETPKMFEISILALGAKGSMKGRPDL
ncbi:hypothetical protein HQN89_27040 [Paenibacillus frigoriresistens]|uniref:hypothetical protein n=1 Tax=Paenibacillus alginolyticus TaxID=59839 RepID=UPI00156449F1|nr:hypothetical protein [Paenibacillus frigoriresistens]NRF94563.1 hypothetical protein [Paenibacillus frigoriresistens]